MLFLLPASTVPVAVACGFVLAALIDIVAGRAHPEGLITAVANAWHAVGASLVVMAAGGPLPTLAAAPVLLGALGAQFALDLLAATVREWLGRGIPPALQLHVVALVCLIDVLLTPIGMLAAAASVRQPFAFLVVLPLLALLAAFANDRRSRIEEGVRRLDALRQERARLEGALRRIGDAFASKLDRDVLLELAVQTILEGLAADRARIVDPCAEPPPAGTAAAGHDADPLLERALADAAAAARATTGLATCARPPCFALGHRLQDPTTPGRPAATLVVGRRDRPFSDHERGLLRYLVQQAMVALTNVELHDRLRAQATTDELTGLANHRRFQEILAHEIQHAQRTGTPLALLMLDIDNFKAVNDSHGHQQGDVVLRDVATILRRTCRATDQPARYGGEELAVVLPATDLHGAHTLAETLRRALHAHAIPLGDGAHLSVTASIGIATLAPDAPDAPSLIALADSALYQAKRSGKNRTVLAQALPAHDGGRRFVSGCRGDDPQPAQPPRESPRQEVVEPAVEGVARE
jgi:diguanylate cyclase (GGDEF)-like protein